MHIVHVISSLKLGGAENNLHTLITYFSQKNYRQSVIFFHDGPVRAKIEQLGIPVYQVTGYFYQYDLIFLTRFYNLLKKLKPNIIHSSLWAAHFFGVFIARLLQVKIVSALHTVQEHEGSLRNYLSAISLPRADKVIAVSETVQISAQKKYKLKNIQTISNGIDNLDLRKRALQEQMTREQMGISRNAFVIGSVGRFVHVKNYSYLLEICAQFMQAQSTQARPIHVILVGLGPEQENLQNKARALGIANQVTFIIGEPAYKFYQLFDCFVQPSLFEGLSIALLEALSFGVPCIVTSDDNSHDVINHMSNGVIVKHADLLQALELLWQNDKLRIQLGQRGSETVQNEYSFEQMGKRYESVFKKLNS